MTGIDNDAPQPAGRALAKRTLLAYRRTRYTAGTIEVRVGRPSPAIDALLAANRVREAVLITANNPYSRVMPASWNQRMQIRLAQALRRHPTMQATGTLQRWSEDHLLVLGDARPAKKLARRFRQNAIVIIRLRQPACLHLRAA
jgi:hypothetical protein